MLARLLGSNRTSSSVPCRRYRVRVGSGAPPEPSLRTAALNRLAGDSWFNPQAELAYSGFKVQMLCDRVAGKWNVQAVVANADDFETMLAHAALQAKLRRLI